MNKIALRRGGATKAALPICALLLLLELFSAMRFAASHTPSQLFVFLTFCAIALVDTFLFFRAIFRGLVPAKRAAALVFMALAIGIFVELLTVLGSTGHRGLHTFIPSKRRLVFFSFAALGILQFIYQKCERAGSGCQGVVVYIKAHKSRSYVGAFTLLVVAIVTARIGTGAPFAFYGFAFACIVAALALFACSKISLALTFFLVGFMSGAVLIYSSPVTTGVSWDDQIHYENAVNASYLIESQLTQTERVYATEVYLRAEGEDVPEVSKYDLADNEAHARELDASYEADMATGNVSVENQTQSLYSMSSIGYTAFAVGLWLSRIMRLGFSAMTVFSRMINLIAYCAVIALAISKTPSKKVLFAFVGLLPTSIFLASNFCYDSWLISFVMLGFAYYLRYAWGDTNDFSKKNIALAFVFMYVGLAVKAVYFPVIGIFFLVSAERFITPHGHAKYSMAVVALGFLTLASFALPFLFSAGGGFSDSRGGTAVDSAGQISFILSNPLGYAKILLRFLLTDFLNPIKSASYAFDYAYLGITTSVIPNAILGTFVSTLPAVSLFLIGATSNDEVSALRVSLSGSIWALFLALSSLVLVATALYVSFTPVGLGTVNGCQYRYILPLIVPTLGIALNNRALSFGARKGYAVAALLVAVLFFALCFGCIVIPKYF